MISHHYNATTDSKERRHCPRITRGQRVGACVSKQDACFGLDRVRLIAGNEDKASPCSTGFRASRTPSFFCDCCASLPSYATARRSGQPPVRVQRPTGTSALATLIAARVAQYCAGCKLTMAACIHGLLHSCFANSSTDSR